MSQIKSTYKSRETEETLDVAFYRPIGYTFALASRSLGLSPNAVTFIGALVGIIGGHLLYYDAMRTNLLGIVLIVLSEALDSADGQLARMTGTVSKMGRVIDGIGDNLKFVSIYLHITLRMIGAGSPWWLFGIAVLSGYSHSTQSAIADYFRTIYLHYVVDPTRGDVETIESIDARYRTASWRTALFDKLVLRLYLNYAHQQRPFITTYTQLFNRTTAVFGATIPTWFSARYRERNAGLIKYYNILTTNTRMIVLFAAVITRQLWAYFTFELTVLNLLLAYVVSVESTIGRDLLHSLETTIQQEDRR